MGSKDEVIRSYRCFFCNRARCFEKPNFEKYAFKVQERVVDALLIQFAQKCVFLYIFEVAQLECEDGFSKFEMEDPIWRIRNIKIER